MSSIEAWIIIILVLGVIASNIAVLKYSAKFKMPQFGKPEDKSTSKSPNESVDDEVSSQAKSTEYKEAPKVIETLTEDKPEESAASEDNKKSPLL
jgi:cytoskeletal protein RodZ